MRAVWICPASLIFVVVRFGPWWKRASARRRRRGCWAFRARASKVSDEELARLRLTPAEFHADWNYAIAPRTN